MLKILIDYLRKFKSKLKHFLFLANYRKDTPDSTLKFYNLMKYIYRDEFKRRENFNNTHINDRYIEKLDKNGFITLNLSDISNNEKFVDTLNFFKNKYDQVIKDYSEQHSNHKNKKKYLLQYNFEFNHKTKNIADPFVDIATRYLGTLPILASFQMWYSPNDTDELIGSKLLHRDPEDFKQLKIFIPITEVSIENGPLHVIDKNQSEILYKHLIKKNLIKKRNQKIDDKHATDLNLRNYKILMNSDQCAIVDTCSCYHFGSRKSSKPRKLIFLHFTTAFSAKTPIFRNYDVDNKFSTEKDKLVYGLQKKTINHHKKRQYLSI